MSIIHGTILQVERATHMISIGGRNIPEIYRILAAEIKTLRLKGLELLLDMKALELGIVHDVVKASTVGLEVPDFRMIPNEVLEMIT